MKIVKAYPPNIEKIKKIFPNIMEMDLVITYGDTLYNPKGANIEDHLIVHEARHSLQQLNYPGGPEAFCDRFFVDKDFRLQVELEAYRDQYMFLSKKFTDRNKLSSILQKLASDLSGPAYGLDLSVQEARRLIQINN